MQKTAIFELAKLPIH